MAIKHSIVMNMTGLQKPLLQYTKIVKNCLFVWSVKIWLQLRSYTISYFMDLSCLTVKLLTYTYLYYAIQMYSCPNWKNSIFRLNYISIASQTCYPHPTYKGIKEVAITGHFCKCRNSTMP